MENNAENGLRLLENCTSTVSSFQGLENYLMIFNAGRVPLDKHPLGEQSLFDILGDLYVITTRARFNLVIIASITYMTDK